MKATIKRLLLFLLATSFWATAQENPRVTAYYHVYQPQTPTDRLKGILFFENALEEDLSQKDTLKALYDLELLGIGYYDMGNYYRAEEYLVRGRRLLDAAAGKDTLQPTQTRIFNQLGLIYTELQDFKKASENYERALQLAQSTRDSVSLYNNIGDIQLRDSDSTKALQNLWKAQQRLDTTIPINVQGRVLTNLGRAQMHVDLNTALSSMEKGLQLRKESSDNNGLYASYKHLSRYYSHQGLATAALAYADSALAIAKKQNSPMYRKDAYSLLLDLGQSRYAAPFQKLTDSLVLAQQQNETQFASLKYDVEKERQRTQALELQQEREKRLRWLIIGLGVVALLALSFYLYLVRTRQRQREQQQVLETESRISKRVHDEVANEVYGVMTRLQSNKETKTELLDQLERLYNKTRNISREYNPIDYEDDYGQLLSDLILTYRSEAVNVITRDLSKIDWNRLSKIKKTVLYRVLQELLTNMKKHSGASVVVLRFAQEGKKLQVDYADNGQGTELKRSGGLRITETRIQSIGGTITFETDKGKGFKAKITL